MTGAIEMGPCVSWPIFHRALVALALMLAVGRLDFAWADEALVVDLSDSEVEITADFNGSSVLMFGALDMPGDVIVVVRGPLQRQIVRRKSRVSGIWLNTSAAT